MSHPRKRILVIDDEPEIAELIQSALEHDSGDYEVITANSGNEGLQMTKNEHPDLVILDVMLPSTGGYEVCAKLKCDSSYPKVPVIMLTARGGDLDKKMGLDCGADMYLTKPFDRRKLLNGVHRLLA